MRRIAVLFPLAVLLAYGCGGDSSSGLDDAVAGSSGSDSGACIGGSAGSAGAAGSTGSAGSVAQVPYPVVDTGQVFCYGATSAMTCPPAGDGFYGQDAQFQGNQPDYTTSADGLTVRDNVTGLNWQRSPDTNRDGQLTVDDKVTFEGAKAYCESINTTKPGGFDDWRLPSIKELYSLIDFRGTDPSGLEGDDTSSLTPFIDNHFQFAYGQTSAGERIIDSQYASSTLYVNKSWTGSDQMFGVNFADGRIKGYDLVMPGGKAKTFFVQCVRGNTAYGLNAFVDNGDQTITDQATGLMWARDDSGASMVWQSALAWVQARNAESFLGHDDWRMPNAKELQSILDYTRSPDSSQSAAIDPVFHATAITNEDGIADYAWYWTSTTHAAFTGNGAGVYVAFGRAGGWQQTAGTSCYVLQDVHGAGAQRSDPKTAGNLPVIGTACNGGTAYGMGPQGDSQRGTNFVRLVRNGAVAGDADAGPLPEASIPPQDGGPPPGDGGTGPSSCNTQSDCDAQGACPSTLGCTCTQTPEDKVCVPKCSKNSDCPKPPNQTLVCGPNGLCVPG